MSSSVNKLKIFPDINKNINEENIQIQTYGQRLYKDQTLYEYLLEFLLIFVSAKSTKKQKFSEAGYSFEFFMETHEQLVYYPAPKMGLKRYVFLKRSELDKRFQVDTEALEEHRDILRDKINIDNSNLTSEFILDILQDLLYGFNAIIGKRSWFAQSLLPVAPELIFCEAIGKKTERNKHQLDKTRDIDGKFDFNYRAFMARGGEVYYLHVLQGIEEYPGIKNSLEMQLRKLISSVPQLSSISQFVQNNWRNVKYADVDMIEGSPIEKIDYVAKNMEWIPDSYRKRASYTVQELINLLESSIDTLEKIKLLSSLIILQIMRMMSLQAHMVLNDEDRSEWLIDVLNDSDNQIRKMAIMSYSKLEEDIFRAVHYADIKSYIDKDAKGKRKEEKIYEDASKDTNGLIRKLGKQLGFIIPPKGGNMRFGMNEEIIKVLVISIIPAGERMLYTTFLNKCYEHFRIIIGPKEARMNSKDEKKIDLTMFNANAEKFQVMLKDSGFLRDLSDSTSIVENPFQE